MLFIDLDHFSIQMIPSGHSAGRRGTEGIKKLLQETFGGRGIQGRWGGEEFVCILYPSSSGALEIASYCARAPPSTPLRQAPNSRYVLDRGRKLPDRRLGPIAFWPVKRTSKVMYVAKSLGRNQVRAAQDVCSSQEFLSSDPSSREDEALTGLVEALAALVNMRDKCTGNHIDDVKCIAASTAVWLGLSDNDVRLVGIAAKLHDIGKSRYFGRHFDQARPADTGGMDRHASARANRRRRNRKGAVAARNRRSRPARTTNGGTETATRTGSSVLRSCWRRRSFPWQIRTAR